MDNTKDLVQKSITYEYDSIQNIYLAITKEIAAFVELDFFPMKKTNVLDIAYVNSLIDILQKMILKHSFHLKRKQLCLFYLQNKVDDGYHNYIVNKESGILLFRESCMLINRTIIDRMISKEIMTNKESELYYYEYSIKQFLEYVYQIMKINYCNTDSFYWISTLEYDQINREIIKLVRSLEGYPFHQKQYKQQCKKVLIETKNLLTEMRDDQRGTRKVSNTNNPPPPPWFADAGTTKKDLFKSRPFNSSEKYSN